ncbi:MAG: SH3 domain-containing protein [Candidatus Aminicenantales bacterium]
MSKQKFPIVFLAVLAVSLLLAANLSAFGPIQVKVKVEKANIRESPLLTAPIVATALKGDVFNVFEKSDEWYLVKLPGNKTGYLHQFVVDEVIEGGIEEAAEAAPPAEAMQITVKVERANIRQAAQMEALVVGSASKGQVFTVLEKSGEWYLIELADGTKGYIHQFVVTEGAEAAAAEVAPTPEETMPVERPAAKTSARVPAAKVKAAKGDTFSMFLARVGYFLSSDAQYKDVYSDGMVFGGELRFGGKSLGGWLEGNYRSATGKLTYTEEETKMSVMAIEAGALYRFAMDQLNPYLGGGVGMYMFNEKSTPMGEAKKSSIGFCVIGGASFFLGDSFVVDARIKWSTCSMKPADFDINVGGITLGLGLGIRF